MARTWWTIEVELVSGRGEYVWPRPGRILIARPGWTFRVLADAINQAFGRWELSHLHAFTMADGTRIAMPDPWGDLDADLDDTQTKMTRLQPGEVFAFTFDYGDGWDHLCTVGPTKVDPADVAGLVPRQPIPIFGWGSLPNQHGRRWSDDDGEGPVPRQPDPPAGDLPPVLYDWGPQRPPPQRSAPRGVEEEPAILRVLGLGRLVPWDDASLRELRGAVARRDVDTAERLLAPRDVGDVAQQAAPILILLARRRGGMSHTIGQRAIDGLVDRDWPGDRELATEIAAALGEGRDLASIPIPVDLEVLAVELERDPDEVDAGWYIDLRDGGWICTDEGLTGMAVPDDLDDDTRYLPIHGDGSNEGWHDMALFAEYVEDGELAERLDEAIRGRGAFRRFGDALRPHEAEWQRWRVFSQERSLGRARFWLELRDYRPAV